jgi:hypothetical protein
MERERLPCAVTNNCWMPPMLLDVWLQSLCLLNTSGWPELTS